MDVSGKNGENADDFIKLNFTEALRQYSQYVRSVTYSFPERHKEDLFQEGLIAIEAASRTYDPQKGVPFSAYLKLCVKRRIFAAYTSMRKNDEHLSIEEDEVYDSLDIESDVVEKKYTEDIFSELRKNLTELEKNVLSEYLRDKSYAQIAVFLGVSEKVVDNTLSRIKNKLKKVFPEI